MTEGRIGILYGTDDVGVIGPKSTKKTVPTALSSRGVPREEVKDVREEFRKRQGK